MDKHRSSLTKPTTIAAVIICLAVFGAPAHSGPLTSGKPASKAITDKIQQNSWKVITWNNGKRDVTRWLNPEEYAEFYVPDNSTKNSTEKLRISSATALRNANSQQVKKHGITTIWRADPQQVNTIVSRSPADIVGAAPNTEPPLRVSPVFHSSPHSNSPRMALPGNIIIRFQSNMTVENIDTWLTRQGLLKVRNLPGDGLTVVVKSEPGMAALNLVEQLSSQAEIDEISPNWWSEPQLR